MTFIEELSGLGIVMVLDSTTVTALNVKITRNKVPLNVSNASDTELNLNFNEVIGILDSTSLGYDDIKHRAQQQFENLHKHSIVYSSHSIV